MGQNPTIGLTLWGPLIPANDCKPCIFLLCGIQMAAGLTLWQVPGRQKPGVAPRSPWAVRSIRTLGVVSGTVLMALAALEAVRFMLPADPWVQDAARARREAEARGEKVSKWFGPKNYTPVEYTEWNRRMEQNITRAESMKERIDIARNVYHEMKASNRQRVHDLLTELQKTNVLSPSVMASDGDSAAKSTDPLWDPLDPWDELSAETDIEVRLMPHTKGVQEEEPSSVS